MKPAEQGRYWWLRRSRYLAIFLRELTSLFILLYVLVYVQILAELRVGESATLALFRTTPFVLITSVLLALSLYHSITWFMLLARAQPIKIGSFRLQGGLALAVNVALLILLSLIVASLFFGVNLRPGAGA